MTDLLLLLTAYGLALTALAACVFYPCPRTPYVPPLAFTAARNLMRSQRRDVPVRAVNRRVREA